MKQIILAAGYATRLYPLTQNTPKPLLPVGGRPMLEHVLDSSEAIGGIDHTYVVTNDKFTGHFEDWRRTQPHRTCTVVNDGTTSNEDRLGAIGDLHWVIEQHGIDDDLLVIAGDNLFTGDLSGFGARCRETQTPVLGVYDVGSLEEATKYGVVAVNDTGQISSFEEKPAQPQSTLIGIALYYCLLYTSPSPRDQRGSRMPSSA